MISEDRKSSVTKELGNSRENFEVARFGWEEEMLVAIVRRI
jgi:hypothetical protein